MQSVDRYNEYKDESLDLVIMKIKNRMIKCGKYSKLIKIDKKKVIDKNQKEFFN